MPYRLIHKLLLALPPETAHRSTIKALRFGAGHLFPRIPRDLLLETEVLGLNFPSPLGLAAGFDKDAEVPDAILRLGFGFVEVGTLTPRPQAGNPQPRLFRLKRDRAVINRMGFNNCGAVRAAQHLSGRNAKRPAGPVGINLGANKDSADRIADYAFAAQALRGLGDYYVINVSSPNTPGLRALQDGEILQEIIFGVRAALAGDNAGSRPPLLVKVAPDLNPDEREALANSLLDTDIDGLIVSNTTISRPEGLVSRARAEEGGLSGAPLFDLSTEALSDFFRLTRGRLPLIGVGGISSGKDAYAKIRAGASLIQLYTAMIYEGPGLVRRVSRELAKCLKEDNFENVAEAVGAAHGKVEQKDEAK